MSLVILETVEVLVPLGTYIALVWLFFLHTNSAWIRLVVIRIEYREGAVAILL